MADKPTYVLLLEDDADDAFLVQDMLREQASGQFEVEHVTRTAEAVRRISERRPDVVLSDLSVPDSQGLEAFYRLRQPAGDVPIVLLTGLDDEEIAIRAVHEGAQDYLTKSKLDGALIVRSLRYAIERQRTSHYRAVLLERQRFDTAIAHMSDGILVTDGDCRLTNANRAGCLLLNIDPESYHGVRLDEAVRSFELSRSWEALHESTARSQAFDIMRTHTEPPLYLDARLTRLFDAQGRMESCVLALRDVTEERRQQELRMGFLMMVSHKLRTPLTVLIACLDLCRRLPAGRGATQLAEVLQVCDVEVQKLGETVAKLLDFKAASQRDVDGEVETAEVGPVLAGACEAVSRHHPERQVRLEVRVAPSVQQVACGPEHLSLVLEKLLDNAVKFGDKDPARVAVVAEPGEPGWVRVSVTDNGPGIPHEYFDRIFEPFVQIEDLPTGQVPGLGVGLAMARQVVSAFGGTVSVQSRLGEGSTFTFTLPSAGSLG